MVIANIWTEQRVGKNPWLELLKFPSLFQDWNNLIFKNKTSISNSFNCDDASLGCVCIVLNANQNDKIWMVWNWDFKLIDVVVDCKPQWHLHMLVCGCFLFNSIHTGDLGPFDLIATIAVIKMIGLSLSHYAKPNSSIHLFVVVFF